MAMERDNRAPRSRKRRKVCAFCVDKVEMIDFKAVSYTHLCSMTAKKNQLFFSRN